MKKIKLGNVVEVPHLAVGCMRIIGLDDKNAQNFISTSLELGLNFFDHADIYGAGECESKFSKAIKSLNVKREDIFIQSKCGIVPGKMYDFSKEHIIDAVNGSLKRLDTDYLDCLLLHRPDALFEPEEVGEAFDILQSEGKVKYFGVSNFNPSQIKLLQTGVKQKVVANQLQFSPTHASMISSGLEVNMLTDGAVSRDGSILDFCRLENITVQPWSPFQSGFFGGVYLNNENYAPLNEYIKTLCEKYDCTDVAIVIAWLCRHPAKMQTVTGTMNAQRLKDLAVGVNVNLTREEWYKLYISAGHILP